MHIIFKIFCWAIGILFVLLFVHSVVKDDVYEWAAKTNVPNGVPNGVALSKQELDAAEFIKTGALCAGFYDKWGPGSIQNCGEALKYPVFSEEFSRHTTQCMAYQTRAWMLSYFDGTDKFSPALREYLKANKSIYEEEYLIGISKNPKSQFNADSDTAHLCLIHIDSRQKAILLYGG